MEFIIPQANLAIILLITNTNRIYLLHLFHLKTTSARLVCDYHACDYHCHCEDLQPVQLIELHQHSRDGRKHRHEILIEGDSLGADELHGRIGEEVCHKCWAQQNERYLKPRNKRRMCHNGHMWQRRDEKQCRYGAEQEHPSEHRHRTVGVAWPLDYHEIEGKAYGGCDSEKVAEEIIAAGMTTPACEYHDSGACERYGDAGIFHKRRTPA